MFDKKITSLVIVVAQYRINLVRLHQLHSLIAAAVELVKWLGLVALLLWQIAPATVLSLWLCKTYELAGSGGLVVSIA